VTARRGVRALVLLGVAWCAVAAALAASTQGCARSLPGAPKALRIAGGPEGGSYLPIARTLARAIEEGIPGVSVTALTTEGGPDNVRLLEAVEADLAMVQNNVTPGGRKVFAIAPLYQEFLHLVAREGSGIARLDDIRGKRVGMGPVLSGTDGVARAVLAHFEIATTSLTARNVSHADAAAALDRGELDAVFVLTGLKAPIVSRLLAPSGRRLVALGAAGRVGSALEGVRVDAPFLDATVIPERTYGDDPPEPVGTIGVRAILVSRADLPDGLIREVTRAIFERKVELGERDKLLARLSEHFDAGDVRFPMHEGALAYMHREDPPLVVVWADALSLLVSLLVLLGSGGLAVHGFIRRRRKNRIDKYYDELQTAATEIHEGARLEALVHAKEALHKIRRRAFVDLMAERLEANESFTIFQDYLRSELGEVDSLIRRRESAPGTRAGTA